LITEFAYNGDGVRTSKTVAGVTTEYVLDLAATLPVVISDTEAVYLYGLDIIAQQQFDRLYYVHDGLGSVRQLVDTAGQIETNYAYDPFGVPLVGGDVYNPYQFTGEAWDAEVGLLYLRARYYQPEVGRFITKDPWPGDQDRAATLNRYIYVTNNPINYPDPGGLQGPDPLGLGGLERPTGPGVPSDYPDDFVDHRDITIWLWAELRANGLEATVTMRPFRDIPYPGCRSLWLTLWLRRVADDHTWDFKDQIEQKLGDTVMLRGSGEAFAWYEFSIPGNINFGYAGRAAGWPGPALHVGASLAQITDQVHKERGDATCLVPRIPDDVCPSLLQGYLNPDWRGTLYDSPDDWWSVEFGIQLWDQHPVGLTLDQFRSFLATHSGLLAGSRRSQPSDVGQYRDPQDAWPYPTGHFNGPRSDFWPLGVGSR